MTDTHSFVHLLLVIAAVLLTTRALSVLAERFGQPAILGELVGGVLLGASVLGILDPADLAIHTLAQLGLLILLFEIGLATDLRALTREGGTAAVIAVVGVVLPFVIGYAALSAMGIGRLAAIVCAASLTATSISVSTRVLAELGFLQTQEGRVVLGAAVLDDIIGLVILSVIGSFAAGVAITATGVVRTSAVAFGFVAIAIIVGSFVVPPLFHAAKRLRSPTTIAIMGLAFAFSLAALAGLLGSAIIVGGFVAGVLLNRIDQRDDVQRSAGAMGSLLTPIFFASVGASVDLRALAQPRTLLITLVLLVTGAVGKVIAAYVPVWFKGNKALVGAAMLPRGEVELIVAQTGLAIGALDASLFGSITLMVLLTTLLSPPLIQGIAKRDPRALELRPRKAAG
ncbi:MAG TPA: cation:proton antiporter [Gemmatimonadetes bacterium]|jgi:Kef-type K+ transport system membrane component KefB|nr:cation:proton antiporter [Gemmatimonadota bacterium]